MLAKQAAAAASHVEGEAELLPEKRDADGIAYSMFGNEMYGRNKLDESERAEAKYGEDDRVLASAPAPVPAAVPMPLSHLRMRKQRRTAGTMA